MIEAALGEIGITIATSCVGGTGARVMLAPPGTRR
jgi:hypothetical protein